MTWQVTLHAVLSPPVFRILRKVVSAAALAEGGSLRDSLDLELAVGEALNSIYLQSYEGRTGPAVLEMDWDGARFQVALKDDGKGAFHSSTGDRGMGFSLIRGVMDVVEVTTPRGGTRLRMEKRLRR